MSMSRDDLERLILALANQINKNEENISQLTEIINFQSAEIKIQRDAIRKNDDEITQLKLKQERQSLGAPLIANSDLYSLGSSANRPKPASSSLFGSTGSPSIPIPSVPYQESRRSESVNSSGGNDDIDSKKINQILGSLPGSDAADPVCVLINFCKHQLKFDIDFPSVQAGDDGAHTVGVRFPGNSLIASASDRKKKEAKKIAARDVLVRLNTDQDFLHGWIAWSLKAEKEREEKASASSAASMISVSHASNNALFPTASLPSGRQGQEQTGTGHSYGSRK